MLTGTTPGRLGAMVGRLLAFAYRLTGRRRYDAFRLEKVCGFHILVLPSVANPRTLRTGAFFASRLDGNVIAPDAAVLDLGTGSGICALVAARYARRVVATDVNAAAIHCTRVNASINGLTGQVDTRHGDLFEPVDRERFDLVLLNPPFLLGRPEDDRDVAWRSDGLARRFAADLADHLEPHGEALVVLSTFGDASPEFESELRAHGFSLSVFATKRFVNETVVIARATQDHDRSPGR